MVSVTLEKKFIKIISHHERLNKSMGGSRIQLLKQHEAQTSNNDKGKKKKKKSPCRAKGKESPRLYLGVGVAQVQSQRKLTNIKTKGIKNTKKHKRINQTRRHDKRKKKNSKAIK